MNSLARNVTAMAATRFTLQGSYIDAGYYGSAGQFSPRNVDTPIGKPVIVSGPRSSGSCVIEADLFIQSGKIVGSTPSDFTYTNGATSQQATVSPGDHVGQVYFQSYKGARVFKFTSNYRVYKP